MFTGVVKFYTSVVFFKKYSSCSGLCHLFLASLHVVGIESEYFVVYLSCVYIYVRLIMSSYLLFCTRYLLCNVWYITCCPNEKKLCM